MVDRFILDLRLPDSASLVAVDRDRVQQVMLNLLANAFKFYDPEHGQVGVHLRPQRTGCRRYLNIYVIDS